jgi:two-component system cell cycle sensor histidine kinase/response regulator CckA
LTDKAQTELAPPPGEFRSGAFLLTSGLLLGGAVATGFWAGSVVVPTGVIAALLVFGAFLVTGRSGLFDGSWRRRRVGIHHFATCPDPVFVSDLSGRMIACNPAAESAGLDPLARWSADAGGLRYRLVREARATGIGAETISEGARRVVVSRHGPRSLLWRIERAAPGATGLHEASVPWLRLDARGRIVATNAAFAALLPDAPARIEDVLADAPLRPDGVHVLAATGQVIRAVVLPMTEGLQDVLLIPLDVAEVSGLVPDQFLEDLPVALARLETDGKLTFANNAARQLLGDRVAPGVNITELIEGMGRSITERLQDTTRGRALGRSEIARGTVDGAEIYLQVAFTRTILDGAPSLLAVLSDATELKTLEAQFVQSQKMQAVGQLAGGVAHDFNNLLTAINGHCDLLLMRHDVADVEHGDLMQIQQNANRAAALVRQLLAFSRKQTLRPTVISLQDTLSELMHLLNRLLTDKVTLKIEHGSDLAPVRVDERQLEQVIMNLVVNARDAMPRGGEVRITTRNLHLETDMHRDRAVILPGDYVVIEVADSGHGIPEGKLNKIFEPFYTTKPVGEGTGLGLSTAYGIIKQTGGFIFAESPPGQGAIFTILLPAYDRVDLAPPPEPEPQRARDLTGRGLVLLVEDEDPVRSFAARALRLRGYTVIEAASGEQALEILHDGDLQVDLMVSDVIMPGLDGPGWVREARKSRPGTKVIFMSGYAEDAFVGGDSGVPGSVFLPKPFTLNELTQKVKDLLDA